MAAVFFLSAPALTADIYSSWWAGSHGSCRAEIGGSKYTPPHRPAPPAPAPVEIDRAESSVVQKQVWDTAETQQLSVSFCGLISAKHFRIIHWSGLHVETGWIWGASTFKESSFPLQTCLNAHRVRNVSGHRILLQTAASVSVSHRTPSPVFLLDMTVCGTACTCALLCLCVCLKVNI